MARLASQISSIYEQNADRWDQDRSHSDGLMERAWMERFLRGFPEGQEILDLGCGGGVPLAAYLIAAGCSVTGVDSSPAMIAKCQRRFPDQTWRVGDMRKIDLGCRFSGILAWDSFFHLTFDDQRKMFPLFAQHAASDCRLLFTSGPEHGEALGSLGDATLYHASLAPEEYRALLAENGFAVERHVANDPECGGHTVWLARRES